MDTRMSMYVLLDFEAYYGVKKSYNDAVALIKDISSETLINYISGFSINLFLNENTSESGKAQFNLVNSLLGKCDDLEKKKWTEVIEKLEKKGHKPIMFWNLSNLMFYNLIFENFNSKKCNELNKEEALKVFQSYLIINGIANDRVKINELELKEADSKDRIEEVIIPGLIFQRDYTSTTDLSSQITRGVNFFKYLEKSNTYKNSVELFYKSKGVSSYKMIFKNLMSLMPDIENADGINQLRSQIIDISDLIKSNFINIDFIDYHCINEHITNYKKDDNFGVLREKFLYKISTSKYYLLDIDFYLNQYYNAQIFSFNSFLKSIDSKSNFLSDKGKNFTEDKYLPIIFKSCFTNHIIKFGDDCKNSSKEELCDVYLRKDNKICLFEFKDILLSSISKNSGDKDRLFGELDKKFVKNQKGKPKGVTQLLNAIKDIDSNSISFDIIDPTKKLEIYPIILYTDNSFGAQGINKIHKEKFKDELTTIKSLNINDLVFMNLNYLELNQHYFKNNHLNIFDLIDKYNTHTLKVKYSMTSIEDYSSTHFDELTNGIGDSEITNINKELLMEILES